jgi:ABC-2 type transport system permease protein
MEVCPEKVRGCWRMKILDFFLTTVKMTISQEMAYKFNFLLRMLTLMTFDLVLPFITILIYLKSNGFVGWDFNEILLFQGVFIFVNSIDRMFFQKVDWSLSYDVRGGNFDRYLLFPVNTLAYISFSNFALEHIADMLLGIALIIYAIIKISPVLTLLHIILFFAYICLALVFVFSLAVIKYSIIIRVVRIGRLGELFNTVLDYGQYPINIYNAFLSSLFRYILPLAVIAYFPSTVLLDRASANIIEVAAVILVIFIFSVNLWKYSLKYYTSAGG